MEWCSSVHENVFCHPQKKGYTILHTEFSRSRIPNLFILCLKIEIKFSIQKKLILRQEYKLLLKFTIVIEHGIILQSCFEAHKELK